MPQRKDIPIRVFQLSGDGPGGWYYGVLHDTGDVNDVMVVCGNDTRALGLLIKLSLHTRVKPSEAMVLHNSIVLEKLRKDEQVAVLRREYVFGFGQATEILRTPETIKSTLTDIPSHGVNLHEEF